MALERIDPRKFEGRYVLDHYGRYVFASQFAAGKRVLDCACGVGYGSHLLREAGAAQVVGVDLSDEAITYARQNYAADGIEYVLGDAHHIADIVEGAFDLIISFETIEHLREPQSFLRGLAAHVGPHTRFICSVPNEWEQPPENPFHLHFFDRARFEELLQEFFPRPRLFDVYWSLASVIAVPQASCESLRVRDDRVCRIGSEPSRPDGYVAVCGGEETDGAGHNLLLHSRECFEVLERDLQWLESQRVAWMTTAGKFESELQNAQSLDSGDLRAQVIEWRSVAEERDRTSEEQERIIQWLEGRVKDLEAENRLQSARGAELEHGNRRLLEEKHRLEENLQRLSALARRAEEMENGLAQAWRERDAAEGAVSAMRATLAWRMAERLRVLFPHESLRGRMARGAVRSPVRALRKLRTG